MSFAGLTFMSLDISIIYRLSEEKKYDICREEIQIGELLCCSLTITIARLEADKNIFFEDLHQTLGRGMVSKVKGQ